MSQLSDVPDSVQIQDIKDMYTDRLRVPHLQYNDTFSDFSSFITKYDNSSYEHIMASASKALAPAKTKIQQRERFELKLKEDKSAGVYQEYLYWEEMQKHREHDLIVALYRRCLIDNSTVSDVWVLFIASCFTSDLSVEAGDEIKDSVKFCPWNGELWSYLLTYLYTSLETYEHVIGLVTQVFRLLDSPHLVDLQEVLRPLCTWVQLFLYTIQRGESYAMALLDESIFSPKDFWAVVHKRMVKIYLITLMLTGFAKQRRDLYQLELLLINALGFSVDEETITKYWDEIEKYNMKNEQYYLDRADWVW